MSDDFTPNDPATPESSGQKPPVRQDYTAPDASYSYGQPEAPEEPRQDTQAGQQEEPRQDTYYGYGQETHSAYQQAYQTGSGQPYYGQTQAKGTGTGFGIASLVLGILSIFTFACCVNYILAVLAIIFGIVQIVRNEKKAFAVAGIITAVISIIVGVVFAIFVVNVAEEITDPDNPLYQYLEQYEEDGSFQIQEDSF